MASATSVRRPSSSSGGDRLAGSQRRGSSRGPTLSSLRPAQSAPVFPATSAASPTSPPRPMGSSIRRFASVATKARQEALAGAPRADSPFHPVDGGPRLPWASAAGADAAGVGAFALRVPANVVAHRAASVATATRGMTTRQAARFQKQQAIQNATFGLIQNQSPRAAAGAAAADLNPTTDDPASAANTAGARAAQGPRPSSASGSQLALVWAAGALLAAEGQHRQRLVLEESSMRFISFDAHREAFAEVTAALRRDAASATWSPLGAGSATSAVPGGGDDVFSGSVRGGSGSSAGDANRSGGALRASSLRRDRDPAAAPPPLPQRRPSAAAKQHMSSGAPPRT